MNKGENVPFLYGQASAPPMVPNGKGRVVHPFEIAEEPTAEAYLIAEASPTTYNTHPPAGNSSVILRAGHEESRLLDHQITKGNTDGLRIVNNESIIASRSNNTGAKEHKQLERGIRASNADQGVHELGVSLEVVEREHAVLANFTINPAASEGPKGTYSEPQPASGGYKFQDYESMYEVGGGYKSEDYKSVYDR